MDNIGDYSRIGEFERVECFDLFPIDRIKYVNANNLLTRGDFSKMELRDGYVDIAKVGKTKDGVRFFYIKSGVDMDGVSKGLKYICKQLDDFETNVVKLKPCFVVQNGIAYQFILL